MISPQSQQETAVIPEQDMRTSKYLSLFLAGVMTINLIVGRILVNYYNETMRLESLVTVVILIFWLGVGATWRGRPVLGTGLMAVNLWLVIIMVISQRANMGLMLTASSGLYIATLIAYAWPRRLRPIASLVMTIISLALILADLFWPVLRPPFPSNIALVFHAVTSLLILVVAVLLVRRFSDYSLRGKLIATFIAVTGIPLVVLSFVNYQGLRNALTDSANQNLLTASSQTAVLLDDFFHTGLDTIQAEATIMGAAYDWAYFTGLSEEERVGPVGTLAEQKAISLLIAYRNRDPENITSYALLDINGQVLFEYPRSEQKKDESDRNYYARVMQTGTVYASPVEFDPETDQPYFHFSAIVVDSVGKEVGVLRARYDADYLQQLITRSTGLIGGESFAVLFDENNIHLAHGTIPDVIYKLADLPTTQEILALQSINRLPDKPLFELSTNSLELAQSLKLSESEPIFETVDIENRNRMNQVGVAVMEEQPWKVAYFQPQDVYLAPENTLIRRTVLLTLLTLAVVAGVAFTIANVISQPIAQLGQAARLVAEGDFSVQVVEFGDRETDTMARAFNLMTAQIRDSVANLEGRVAERTRALQISNRVSQQLSTILDRQELMRTVVNQVRDAFDYYHVHIYLFDPAHEYLLMTAGTGEAGETMLRQGHKISKGQGLVGRAGDLNDAVLIADVSQEADWLPNPLLPDTKAETAVPIALADNVLGVLDVQSDQVGGLDDADVEVLRSISNQVAIALRNSQLYAQTQRQVERETMINEINQRILQTTDMQEAMKVALREIGRATGAQQVAVKLGQQLADNGHEMPDHAESQEA